MARRPKTALQQALQKKKLSQVDLASTVGLTPALISLICLGKSEPKVGVAIKIGKAVGESVEDLFADFV